LLAGVLVVLALCGRASATDLSGRWHLDSGGAGELIDLTQSGDTVTIPLSPFATSPPWGTTLDTTFSGSSLNGSVVPNPNSLHDSITVEAKLITGNLIDGYVSVHAGPSANPWHRFLVTRCECDDGNSNDGDGCDHECRVEPCFSCTGSPSVCTPLADGSACDDRQDCTTGEACNNGTCGGGSAVPSCIDLTGRWRVDTPDDQPAYLLSDVRDVEQHDGIVRFRRPLDELTAEVGTFDQSTRALNLSSAVLPGVAPGGFLNTFPNVNSSSATCDVGAWTGIVTADGSSFAGSGIGSFQQCIPVFSQCIGSFCTTGVPYSQTGHRCATGECDFVPEQCPPCQTRDSSGLCRPGPRDGCLRSLHPVESTLRLRRHSWSHTIAWRWNDGQGLSAASLGVLSTDYDLDRSGLQICIFNGNSSPVFEGYWTPVNFGDPRYPCWTKSDDSMWTSCGAETVAITTGTDHQSSVLLIGSSGDIAGGVNPETGDGPYQSLPDSPIELPLRIQATIDHGGACFESTFNEHVGRNTAGVLRGRASE
jgi:cysteine-rich repeat protein